MFGSSQRFGVPMGYGDLHTAFLATYDEMKRTMPGRIIGVSRGAAGDIALRMAIQTRGQHIRHEKANSNICTSQVLLTNIAGLCTLYHGLQGLRNAGLTLKHDCWVNTLTVEVADKADVLTRDDEAGINLRRNIHSTVDTTIDERTMREDV